MTRQLAQRSNDGREITLLWESETDHVSVVVRDVHTGAQFELPAPCDRALDAFHHPFAYAT